MTKNLLNMENKFREQRLNLEQFKRQTSWEVKRPGPLTLIKYFIFSQYKVFIKKTLPAMQGRTTQKTFILLLFGITPCFGVISMLQFSSGQTLGKVKFSRLI